MRYYLHLLPALCLLLVCCGKKETPAETLAEIPETAQETPAVAYEMKQFELYSSDDCGDDSSRCASYTVHYPEFTNVSAAVAARVRRRIDSVLSIGYSEGLVQPFEQTAAVLMEEYRGYAGDDPEAAGAPWYYEAHVAVEQAADSLVTLTVSADEYMGGAHPNAVVYFINFNPRTGADVKLAQVLKPGYEKALTQAGETVFRDVREMEANTPLNEIFEFPDGRFQLNGNYGFTREGIVFYFNNYEIAPYAAGPTEILIPYNAVKAWIQ